MKTRLPKNLLALVVFAAISTAQASIYNPTTITYKDEMVLGTKAETVGGYTIDAKDGAGEATITESVTSGSALYVREGKLTISGTEESPTVVTINTSTGGQYVIGDSPTLLNVAGKDTTVGEVKTTATLVIDNATFTTSKKAATSIGGPDGNGTLIIQNGGKYLGSAQNYFYIGYQSHRLDNAMPIEDKQIAHATTQNTGDDRISANRFDGSYTTNAAGDVQYGRGVVTVTGNSVLETGVLEVCMGEGELNILDHSTFTTGAKPTLIGYVQGCTSVVNVENGSVWNVNGNFQTGSLTDNTKTEINVKNATINLNYKKGSTLGVGKPIDEDWTAFVDNGSTTQVKLEDKAKLNVTNVLEVGWAAKAQLTIDETSSVNASDETANIQIFESGVVVNAGKMDLQVNLDGGELTMADGAKAAGLTASAGTLSVLGDVVFNGDIMLSNTGFLFTDGATIDLQGHDFSFDGGAVTIVVNAATPAVAMFSLEDEEMLASYGITFKNAGTVTGFEDDIEVTIATMDAEGQITKTDATYILKASDVKVQSIPEPTTATLSLLALAGLCARRRRK